MVSRIVVDEEENLLEVIVPDDQLTNAIGRKGQNVKLAAKPLGWKVDLSTETRYNEANAIGRGLEQVASVAEVSIENLLAAGYSSLDKLRAASDEELEQALNISRIRIADLRSAIHFLAPVVEDDAKDSEE
jgi:N utilization substance protein A